MTQIHWEQIFFCFFCIITLVQLFYYCFFFARLAIYKPKPNIAIQNNAISVIVCARDEEANLDKNLEGLLTQHYNHLHEVVVVDDNSFDNTKYLLQEFEKKYPHLQLLHLSQEALLIPGKKFPLSMGIKTAKYPIVLLTDADCMPASHLWIDKMQQSYTNETEIVLGYGPYAKQKGLLNKFIRWETMHTAMQYFSYAILGLPYMGVGRNLSYKKSLFFKHKGFTTHNNIVSGDDDLFISKVATKKNTTINIDAETFTYSQPAHTWAQWYKQKNRHYTTAKYYKPIHKLLLGLYSLTQFLFYPLFFALLFFYFYKWVLIIFTIKFFIQAIILKLITKKLKENDLFFWFLVFDIGMFFYYIIFSIALFKKPKKTWM